MSEFRVRIPITRKQWELLAERPALVEHLRRSAALVAAKIDREIMDNYIREICGE